MKRFFLCFLLLFPFASSASTLTTWQQQWSNYGQPWQRGFATPQAACGGATWAYNITATTASCSGDNAGKSVQTFTETCPFGDNRASGLTSGIKCNTSCDAPKVMSNGQCVAPPTCDPAKGETLVNGSCVVTNQCAAKKDQKVGYKVSGDPVTGKTYVVDGCAVSSGGVWLCHTSGETGKKTCSTSGTYTGQQGPASPELGACGAEQCPKEPPTVTGQNQNCTAPAVNNGTTTYTCLTESNANEFASSNCAVGTVNGVQGLHCAKPDYVPESDNKKREDKVTEVTNPDGSKTTTTTSTTTTKHCKAGACTTTSTTTTTTSGKDANGNPTGTTTTCKGDKCDNPTTPGKDESEEEGEDEETTATFSGDALACGPGSDCSSSMDPAMRTMFGEDQKILGYADSAKLVMDGFYQSPLATALNGLRWPSSSVCPVYTLSLWGGSFAIAEHCAVIANISGFLSAAFMAIWSFAAIRLFMTA